MNDDIRTSSFELDNSLGKKIRGNVHSPANAEGAPVLLFCHGFKGFKDWGMVPHMMNYFAQHGWVAIRFNFSLNGIGEDPLNFTELDNFRDNTFSQELEDVETVIQAVINKAIVPAGCDVMRLALVGHSRGGGIAIISAAEQEGVRSVVALSSVVNYNRWGEKTKEDWRSRGVLNIMNTRTKQKMPLGLCLLEDAERNSERLDIRKAASRLNIPLLVIHGEQDVSVPIQEAQEIYAASDSSLSRLDMIPNAAHTFGATHPWSGYTPELEDVMQRMTTWLSENTRSA
jgi:uncharacterized protein